MARLTVRSFVRSLACSFACEFSRSLPPSLVRSFVHLFIHFFGFQYLSTADERLEWQANSLPADDLCTENAIMLKRFNRYPLIIDPSGQATEFLLNEYKGRKINKTRYK